MRLENFHRIFHGNHLDELLLQSFSKQVIDGGGLARTDWTREEDETRLESD